MTTTPADSNGHTVYPMPRAAAVRQVLDVEVGRRMPSFLYAQVIPSLTAQLAPHLRAEPVPPPTIVPAVAEVAVVPIREIEVLALASTGLTNARIGVRLGLSTDTVKTYIRRALVRLGARDRTQAVAIAIRRGLIP